MIILQRASAGSGKTFTLTKKFIYYLISTPRNPNSGDGERRLCKNSKEILYSLRGILAITFTNAATAEMKKRIVDSLHALSDPFRPADTSKVDYLNDIMTDFGVSRDKVAEVCSSALKVVLNNFSDFNVSTIDSFFQSVLRTFAYETNLPDSYQVEMDSDMLAETGVNASLDSINADVSSSASVWFRKIMDSSRENGDAWNPFARSQTYKSKIYRQILEYTKKMKNESYKRHSKELDEFFNKLDKSGLSFSDFYDTLKKANEEPVKVLYSRMKAAANTVLEKLADPAVGGLFRTLETRAHKLILSRPYSDPADKTMFSYSGYEKDKANGTIAIAKTNQKKKAYQTPEALNVKKAAEDMYDAWDEWVQERTSPRTATWQVYGPTLLSLGLIYEIRKGIQEYLTDNNLVELADTGMILKEIIDGSDVPFIYERLGTRLNHYLIDEFQDTSTLQYENLKPLLEESNSRGEESLVIGDAKQSIYRFRNANSQIISSLLPDDFSDACHTRGDSVEENTNWRSDRNVVEFNNTFFKALSHRLNEKCGSRGAIASVYDGVVQQPSHDKESGLVSLRFYQKSAGNNDDEEEKDKTPKYFNEFGPLVNELLSRGYRQKEIAFLVNTKAQGTQIINSLIKFNAALPEGMQRVDFVSAESLLISSSAAVSTVISVLRAISEPRPVSLVKKEERARKGLGRWDRIGSHILLYALTRKQPLCAELIDDFIKNTDDSEDPSVILREMVGGMQAHTLPALVETIVSAFAPMMDTFASDTPYLAAFQDLMLDYCERYTPDLGSFLRWWDKTGSRQSIASPDNIDAVKIMTIHKSKGLQFKCVVIPEVCFSMTPSLYKKEWLWVSPSNIIFTDSKGVQMPVPPVVPVDSDVLGKHQDIGLHSDIYSAYATEFTLDILNKLYVGFTRAEKELYVYVPMNKSDIKSKTADNAEADMDGYDNVGSALFDIARWPEAFLPAVDNPENEYMFSADRLNRTYSFEEFEISDAEEERCLRPIAMASFGAPVGYAAELEEKRKEKGAEREKEIEALKAAGIPWETDMEEIKPEIRRLNYIARQFPPTLRYRDPDSVLLTGDEDDDDTDPRSRGKILHGILENITVAGDLDNALMRQIVSGRITRVKAGELRAILSGAFADPLIGSWFAPGLRVFNERSLIFTAKSGKHKGSNVSERPDRFVVDSKGNATVVDYKFGSKEQEHHKQVGRYISELKAIRRPDGSPMFRSVKGYLWYVLMDAPENVEEIKR